MGKLTSKELAKLIGVSRATISRVINNNPNVGDKIRRKVQAAIHEFGYEPNIMARSLKLNRANTIGLFISKSTEYVFSDPFFPELLKGLADTASLFGFNVQLFTVGHEGTSALALRKALKSGMIDGMLFFDKVGDRELLLLQEEKVPFVLMGKPVPERESSICYICVNDKRGSYKVVEHLIKCGHRRIAYIAGSLDFSGGTERLAGYKEALYDYGLEFDPGLLVYGDFTQTGGHRAMHELLQKPERPEAVAVANDLMALGAMRAIHESGLTIPDDIGIVGFNGNQFTTHLSPPLTTVRQPTYESGCEAAKMLIKLISGKKIWERHIVLPVELVVRQSCHVARRVAMVTVS